jgi:hypothetical protein
MGHSEYRYIHVNVQMQYAFRDGAGTGERFDKWSQFEPSKEIKV